MTSQEAIDDDGALTGVHLVDFRSFCQSSDVNSSLSSPKCHSSAQCVSKHYCHWDLDLAPEGVRLAFLRGWIARPPWSSITGLRVAPNRRPTLDIIEL